jgi:ParB family chromosome partitioning protein
MNSAVTTNNPTAIDSKKPNTKQELIAANIKLLIEQLEAGQSDALTNYLTAMSRFHNYSFGNVLEIARQMPTATRVAGFWTWKNLGRSVKAGQKGILLVLRDAPFNKRDAQLVPAAGSCADCPKRTGHNKLLFGDDLGRQGDRCTDPNCYQAKVTAHVAATIAAKPELVQISTAYGGQKEGSPVLPRNKYTAIRDDTPKSKDEAKRPEFKECKFTTEAIITEGSDVGTIHKVCANPSCPVHHPKQSASHSDDAKWKAEQEKQRKEQAVANTTGLRVLSAIGSAVPVRLLKRDLLFILEKLVGVMDENRVEMLARQHGIRQKRDGGGLSKTLAAFLRRADEGTLSRMLVESSILLAATRGNPAVVLKDAASAYKVDTDAIAAKVKLEFTAKEKARNAAQPATKAAKKAA